MSDGRIIVTGAEGFLGRYLVAHLENTGFEVWRLGRNVTGSRAIVADLTKPGAWQEQLQGLQADAVMHAAGLTRGNNSQSFNKSNVDGTKNLLEAIAGTGAWVAVTSSSAVYGLSKKPHVPLREDSPCRPIGAYAESKLAQERITKVAGVEHGPLHICICRLSNLIGHGQSEDFFLGRIVGATAQLARLKRAEENNLETGSLSSTRDFIDVRDVCKAFVALLSVRAEGIFNVAAGRESLLRDVVSDCIAEFNIGVNLQENSELFVNPIQRQALDISAIRTVSGWRPEYKMKHTLKDIVTCLGSTEIHQYLELNPEIHI